MLRLDPEHPDPGRIRQAASCIRAGGLVAFPTETVYGLGANALDRAAVLRIFRAKGRPSFNPLIVHCASGSEAASLTAAWPAEAERLGAAFWPGPLTLVLPKAGIVPDEVSAGLPTVALRVPRHPVAQALLRAAAVPIAAPSANPSMGISPTHAEHVLKGLAEQVDLVLDAGATSIGIESTVIDLSGPRAMLLRPGSIGIPELERVLGQPVGSPGALSPESPRPSPGMLTRHYAPRARVLLLEPGERTSQLARAVEEAPAGAMVGAIVLDRDPGVEGIGHPIVLPSDPAVYAAGLYAALHQLDDLGCDLIIIEPVPTSAVWAGIRDRLQRASTPP